MLSRLDYIATALLFAHSSTALAQDPAPAAQQTWMFDRLDRIGGQATRILGNPRVIDTPLGKAIEFDGVDDAIFFDVHPLAGAKTFTWEVIFRPDSGGNPEQRFFHLQERNAASGQDTQIRLLFETRLHGGVWYLDSFVNSASASKALIDPKMTHPLDRWYHVAMVYDGKEFRHYVNRVIQGSAMIAFTPEGPGRSSAGVRINLRDYFKGAIRVARFTPSALDSSAFLPLPLQ
jgi:hypothetical protein